MGTLKRSYIFPHPPLIVPDVGKGSEEGALQTVQAVKRAAQNISDDKPGTIIVTTPHGPVFQDYVYIGTSERLSGGLESFGSQVALSFENNIDLVNRIIMHANEAGIMSGGVGQDIMRKYKITDKLDHGVTVPLYFVNGLYGSFKLVHIAISGLPFQELYKFGMAIRKAVEDTDENVVFLASGDLSHRLSHDAPYGFSDKGKEFDDLFIKSIKNLDIEALLEVDESFCESAGECGLRSFLMMFGAFDGYELKPEVYSYEGPFGVGYSVARFTAGGRNPDREILRKVQENDRKKLEKIRLSEDPYVKLARTTLETYVKDKRIIKVPGWAQGEMLENKAGTFVSIKKHGQLRGCIGTTGPTTANIAEEIIQNAISAGTRDPRFEPIEEEELDKLVFSVDILKEPEPISSAKELDVLKYGVIVKAGRRSGLLLPNLEGVNSPEEQVSISLSKAGIKPDEKYSMERFEVIRHK